MTQVKAIFLSVGSLVFKLMRKLMAIPKYFRILSILLGTSFFLFSYQNCSPMKSQMLQNQNMLSQSSTGLSDPTDKKSCVLNGKNYYAGDRLIGYPMSSVVYPLTCGNTVTRTCLSSGQFDGSVPVYSGCVQQCQHPDTGAAMDSGQTYYYYTKSSGATQAECDSAKVTATCQASTGQYSPTVPTSRFLTCKVAGQTCAYSTGTGIASPTGYNSGATVSGFALASATYPNLCGSQVTRTCQSTGSWSGSTPLYSVCTQKCVHPDTSMPVSSGTAFSYYTRSTGTQSECDAARVTLTCSASTGTFGSVPATRYSSCAVTQPVVLTGSALYVAECASCHQALDVSNLKGRVITADKINNGINSISAMAALKGKLTTAQINSLVALFATDSGGGGTTVSSFACSNTEAEKNNSSQMIRLTSEELKNTYSSVLGSTVWSSLSTYYYLLPTDEFSGQISNFTSFYSAEYVEQISRFNEQVANQIVSTSANLSTFFGTCATATAFTQSCFNSFLSTKGAQIFRSALASDDATRIWTTVAQASSVKEQQKTAIQILLNDPRFMFHLELGDGTAADSNGLLALNSYEVANRISYGLTASPPDSTLWADAVANKLKLITNIQAHVDRIATTAAFKTRVVNFIKYYLGISKASVAPTSTIFLNGVDRTNLETAAEQELTDYINYVVFTQKGKFSDLLASKAAFPKTSALATIFGTSVWSSGNPMTAPNHGGLLTKPYVLMSSSSNAKYVQRGRVIRINMLCTDVPQPSAADIADRPTLTDSDLINLTRRQYIDKATLNSPACIVCHAKMNEMGYVSGNFDSIGRFVTTEKIFNLSEQIVATHTIDPVATPKITESDSQTFNNMVDFQNALAQSDSAQSCLARRTVQFFNRRVDNVSYDSCRLNKIDSLVKAKGSLIDVFVQNFKMQSVMYKRSN